MPETTGGVFAQHFGTGARPALAVHCMMGKSDIWGPVLTPLGDRIAATAFDLPGHGKSAPWSGPNLPGAYQTLATDLARGLAPASGPVDLIGHSFGTAVALRLAARRPERVRSLTLIEPVIFAAIRGTPEFAFWSAKQDRQDEMLATGQTEAATSDFLTDWGTGPGWEDLSPRRQNLFLSQMPIVANVAPANFSDPADILRPGAIEKIAAPVLLVHGSDSPAAIATICEALAKRLPNATVVTVPGAGHMLPITHARQTRELFSELLERS